MKKFNLKASYFLAKNVELEKNLINIKGYEFKVDLTDFEVPTKYISDELRKNVTELLWSNSPQIAFSKFLVNTIENESEEFKKKGMELLDIMSKEKLTSLNGIKIDGRTEPKTSVSFQSKVSISGEYHFIVEAETALEARNKLKEYYKNNLARLKWVKKKDSEQVKGSTSYFYDNKELTISITVEPSKEGLALTETVFNTANLIFNLNKSQNPNLDEVEIEDYVIRKIGKWALSFNTNKAELVTFYKGEDYVFAGHLANQEISIIEEVSNELIKVLETYLKLNKQIKLHYVVTTNSPGREGINTITFKTKKECIAFLIKECNEVKAEYDSAEEFEEDVERIENFDLPLKFSIDNTEYLVTEGVSI